jgi:glycosyltransferase involved in cell wall biosynthesis
MGQSGFADDEEAVAAFPKLLTHLDMSVHSTICEMEIPPGKQSWPWSKHPVKRPIHEARKRVWPRISIITPSYNQGQFIEETIRSVLLQDYSNLEYIIIDGGSTDKTIEVIKKYEPWITYWVSEKDRGQCHAINKGFARASGDIFGWLCSDDVLAPGALHQVAGNLSNKTSSMVVGASIITNGPDTLEGSFDRRQPSFAEMAYDVKTLPQPSTFWTRDLWQAAGPLREDLYFVMDYDLWLRMVPCSKSLTYLQSILSYQRTQPAQKSAKSRFGDNDFHEQRVRVGWEAARTRGESGIRWLTCVFWHRLKQSRGRLWRLREPGFHWQAARQVFKTGFR